MKTARILLPVFILLLFASTGFISVFAADTDWSDNSNCMMCHQDKDLTNSAGKKIGVHDGFTKSVHGSLSCTDCHGKGNYDDTPHWKTKPVINCDACHTGITSSWQKSVHGRKGGTSPFLAARCFDCHSPSGDPHQISSSTSGVVGNACMKCHTEETKRYTNSVHAKMFPKLGKKDACATCHPAHGEVKLSDPVAITKTCQSCHTGALDQLKNGPHGIHGIHKTVADTVINKVSCSSCHEPHSVSDPKKSNDAFSNCMTCHHKTMEEFSGSVHQGKLLSGEMTCASCHSVHLKPGDAAFHCGDCHQEPLAAYKSSMHFKDDPTGLGVAANCGDCHDRGHGVRKVSDPRSAANPRNQPQTCGHCHGDSVVTTSDYVRMPMTKTNYLKSIHADKWREWSKDSTKVRGAVCSDCHGSHSIQSAGDPNSITYRQNLPRTCGKCHEQPATDYLTSIHGAANRRGILDTPTCNDCHESHLILAKTNPQSRTFPTNVAKDCGKCHENAELTDRFGIWQGVVKSYNDSYHGWALNRSQIVANCTDCHTTHAIRSHVDPRSTTHLSNVVQTCAKCHANSNVEFARSYTHESFGKKWGYHDYARILYLFLIGGTLGGMLLHNMIVYFYHLREHRKKHLSEKYIVRMNRTEILQHVMLFVTFIGLAITGLALRHHDSWWVQALGFIGMNEDVRALLHRVLAVLLIIGTFWHAFWILSTPRGREKIRNYFPKWFDVTSAIHNLMFHLRMRKDPPRFETYDYTQKAEYWALVWGTFIMGLTGMVLWFPVLATSWTPGWVVRVASVIHYYEALLAVGAIIIWHFFFVIFHPKQYPMALSFVTGRMSQEEWEHHHGKAADTKKDDPNFVHGGDLTSEQDGHHDLQQSEPKP